MIKSVTDLTHLAGKGLHADPGAWRARHNPGSTVAIATAESLDVLADRSLAHRLINDGPPRWVAARPGAGRQKGLVR